MKYLQKFSGPNFKKGQTIYRNGDKLTYCKMVRGKLVFRCEDGTTLHFTRSEINK